MKLIKTKYHFIIIIKISLLIFSSCQEINFKFFLEKLEEYCLSEYLEEQTYVIYNISSNSSKTKYIHKYENVHRIHRITQEFQLPYVTEKTGDYEICITNYDHFLIEVNFSMKYGLGARDYSEVSKRKDLKQTELILEKMEDKARDLAKIISFEKSKYIKIINIFDTLCNKIFIFSFCVVICMIIVGILEIIYLKKFMKERKLI